MGAAVGAAMLVAMAVPLLADAATLLTRQLQQGMSGSDVSVLQSFLAGDVTIYPQGLVTGYYGGLTTSAVSNFQVRNNIPSVGRVGPMTLSAINAQILAGGISGGGDISAPMIHNAAASANSNSASVNWTTSEAARGVVYYSTSPIILGEHLTSVDVSGQTAMTDTSFRTAQTVGISGLSANTTYYYSIYTVDAAGNVSITWPSTFRTL